jgi:glycerophosphoryl diester phosphodiesterase
MFISLYHQCMHPEAISMSAATTIKLFLCAALSALALPGCGSVEAYEDTRLPLVIAHRGGAADYPENTLPAIEGSLQDRADMIWLTVQLSRDGVPMVYRPADLSSLTDGAGPLADKTLDELQRLNAGWMFARIDGDGVKRYPYRAQTVQIPSLQQALRAIPESMPVILDMKALPSEPQAKAVARVLDQEHAWRRTLIYSTDAAYQQAFSAFPQARLFESRDATRERLATLALAQECTAPPAADSWAAFESRRDVQVVETFTLGEARSAVKARFWTPAAIACFRSKGKTNLVAIAVNSAAAYREAACRGMDAVLADSPKTMLAIKDGMRRSALHCPEPLSATQ